MADINKSAKAIIQTYLQRYGLGSLSNWAWQTYIGAGGGTTGMDAITAGLPDTAQFKARFPAYAQLAKEGRAMSIDEMLQYEQTARQIFHAAGLPAGFYDQPKDFAKFMLGNVSTSELQQRVNLQQQAVLESPADVRAQLQRFYGLTTGHLTAHFLDPNVAEPILQRQFTAATLGAEADRANIGITRAQAEQLTRFGVTADTGAQGFEQLGTQQGLFEAQVQGEQAIGVPEQLRAQFEGDTAAQLAFKQREQARLAAFQGDSGFQVGQTGVRGLAQPRSA